MAPPEDAIANDTPARPVAPDWDRVPFDVPCARCGQDLRGLADAKCPACGLEFDWSEAVPIEQLTCLGCDYHLYGLTETRCPECGRAFTWKQVLDAYRRRSKLLLFEYQWQQQPIRSLLATWRRALRPNRFWSSLTVHDDPRVGPLLGMAVVLAAVFVFLVGVQDGIGQWVWWFSPGGFPSSWWIDVKFLAGRLGGSLVESLARAPSYPPTLFGMIWCVCSLLALLLFRQSMRRYKIRASHVLRVWAYSIVLILPLVPAVALSWHLAWLGLYLCSATTNVPPFPYMMLPAVFPCAVWSIRCGYKNYLGMDRPGAVALASQAVAVPATLITCNLLGRGYGGDWILSEFIRGYGLV